ncbi:MAG: polyphosphate kinase 1 [Proteobacteria bacterium]|nr:polyphosphate kinase 1 [Pseudomonadota bacterium]
MARQKPGEPRTAAVERSFNREWSWLRFNERVLEEAEDASNPLLERVKFAAIFATNLDEFFMVRVAGLYRQLEAELTASGIDGRTPRQQIDGVAELAHLLTVRHEQAVSRLLVALEAAGLRVRAATELPAPERGYVRRYYRQVLYPVITPTIVGPKHPFPVLPSGSLALIVGLNERRERALRRARTSARKPRRVVGLLPLPRVLPRFVELPEGRGPRTFVPTESILADMIEELFTGYRVLSVATIRLTRDADIALDEEATEDMRRALAKRLLGRRHGAVVRLEHSAALAAGLRRWLLGELGLESQQCYLARGLLRCGDLMQLHAVSDRGELKYAPLEPLALPRPRQQSIFEWLNTRPRLVHHPYHSFDPIAALVAEAADDPEVLAIKQTLYRTSGDSPVIAGLTRAAERGKHVTAVVELRARFDEERNIEWAKRLEYAGAHVVYGLVGLKTHCKALLVVRREADGIRRYVHLGTGNYNDATARLYTDVGLLTCDEAIGEDVSALFNVITGATEPPLWRKVEMSPTGMRRRLLALIDREIAGSRPGARGRIVAKMNALVDAEMIEALYAASRGGVRVDLIVRGTCCLRPGVRGLSEHIRVRSVVGRWLEHPRVLWLRNGGKEEIYLSSADWMPRNLDHRIELLFPVEEPAHREYLGAVLELQLKDNVKARELTADGRYRRVERSGAAIDSQMAIYDYTRRWQQSAPPTGRRFVPLAHS